MLKALNDAMLSKTEGEAELTVDIARVMREERKKKQSTKSESCPGVAGSRPALRFATRRLPRGFVDPRPMPSSIVRTVVASLTVWY